MSKIVYIASRNRKAGNDHKNIMNRLLHRLAPDNIKPHDPIIQENDGIVFGIYNPTDLLPVKNSSVCIGKMIEPGENWWRPLSTVPDGTFALFRGDEKTLELATDYVASRTIWYVQTEDAFIASTSQRAIVYFLKSFEPNREVFSWMLSSGTLGPGLSWDRRIKCLKGNSRLVLDRSSWKVAVEEKDVEFKIEDLPEKEHESRLISALQHVYGRLGLEPSKWCILLSGGFDSRTTLLMLKDREKFRYVTWGVKKSFEDVENDGWLAKSLAKYYGLNHRTFETDLPDEPIDKIFARFLTASEGRVDHLPGYADGFRIWKYLFESGFAGVVRGDHACADPLRNFLNFNPRRQCAARMLSDFFNLNGFYNLGFERESWPDYLNHRDSESKLTWYVRLYQQFQIPYILAGLNDIKCTYVEIANPLLSRQIIETERTLPDRLRINKTLRKRIVHSFDRSGVGFPKRTALATPHDLLRTPEVVGMVRDELKGDFAGRLFSGECIDLLLRNIKTAGEKASIYSKISQCLLKSSVINAPLKEIADMNVVGFRACLISKMHKMLNEDAAAQDGPILPPRHP